MKSDGYLAMDLWSNEREFKDAHNLLQWFGLSSPIKKLQQIIGYVFNNKSLLLQAMTHKSFVHEWSAFSLPSNERLEFLGDALLGAVIADELCRRFPEFTEGELTRFRMTLVNGQQLKIIGQFLGIPACLALGQGELKYLVQDHQNKNLVANGFEALLGAIYLDSGFVQLQQVICRIFSYCEQQGKMKLFSDQKGVDRDPKSTLQEKLMKRKLRPVYKVIKETQSPSTFEVSLEVADKEIARIVHNSKKKAQQMLAKMALQQEGLWPIMVKDRK